MRILRSTGGLAGTVAVGACCLAVASLILLGFVVSTREGPWNPLGPYPIQTVRNRVVGVDGPAAYSGNTLEIEGVLCNNEDHPVNVLTTLSWQAVGRTGTFVVIGIDIPQTRSPGCETFSRATDNPFLNPMPAEVVAAAKGLEGERWQIVGFEIPVRDDGSSGVRAPFESEEFEIVEEASA